MPEIDPVASHFRQEKPLGAQDADAAPMNLRS
jgi:hypothetical protein